MGQFHVKTGFLGNGRRNLISTSVNTETESHKYGNGQTKIENGTGIFPSVFNPKHYKKRSTATLTLSELASKKFQQSTDTERASPAQHQTANHKTANCFRKHWPQILTMLVSHHTSRQQLTSYTVSLRSKFSSVPEKKIRQF